MLLNAFFALAFLAILICIWWYGTMPRNLPPGPIGLPFVGSTFDTWRASNLHRKLRQWADIYGPVYSLYVADKLVLILASWEMIQEALVKQGDVYAGRPHGNFFAKEDFKPGTGLARSEGESWKIQRRFSMSTLRDFGLGRPIMEPAIRDESEYLIEAIQINNGQPFDPAPLLNNAVSNVVCALVFGRRFQYDDKKYRELLNAMRARLSENDISPITPFIISKRAASFTENSPKAKKFFEQGSMIAKFLREEIAELRKNFDPDKEEPSNYVQAFFKAQRDREDNWSFTDDELLSSVKDFFIAGTDTTATTVRWSIFYLAHNPEWQKKLHEEIHAHRGSPFGFADRTKLPFTEAFIMETQRTADLVPLSVTRRTMVPSKLCGYDIPEDTVVVPVLSAAMRDPKVYPNPDKFDPSRFLKVQKDGEKAAVNTHLIPFAAGKRICSGESLARMELFLFFTALVANFKFHFPTDRPIPSVDGELVSLIRAPPKFTICVEPRVD